MIINVLGLGPSLSIYDGSGVSIGCNDIWSRFKSDFVVCMDKPDRFIPDRRAVIDSCRPAEFMTSSDLWSYHPCFSKLELSHPRSSIKGLFSGKICYSNNSAFVAAVVALEMGATEVRIFGVDIVDHPALSKTRMAAHVLADFERLAGAVSCRFRVPAGTFLSRGAGFHIL